MATASNSSRRTRKVAAIAAGVLVIGVAATYTLASWNDSEWVWGGASGNTPGVGTETFEVQQNTSSPFADPVGNWADRESNPGGNLTFSTGALALTPGDSIYAPVALRTTADSVAGDVTLQAAVPAMVPGTSTAVTVDDPDGDLWKSIQVSVYTETVTNPDTSPTAACSAAEIGNWGAPLISNATLDTVAPSHQELTAQSGSTQHYCFVLTLPTTLPSGTTVTSIDGLQARTIAPAWEFASVSK